MEHLTQAIEFRSSPKLDQSSVDGQLSFSDIVVEKEQAQEEAKPTVVEEPQGEPKAFMTTKEAAALLGWTEEKLTSRRKRGQALENESWKLTYEKQSRNIVWRARKSS